MKRIKPVLCRTACGMLAAALLVCAVFAVGYFLFILFCDKIWFQ